MNLTTVSVLSIAGTSLCICRSIPQLVKSIRSGFSGLSLATWTISLCEITVWALWAIITQQWIVGISSFLMWPVSLFFIFKIVQYRQRSIHATTSLEVQVSSLTSVTYSSRNDEPVLI